MVFRAASNLRGATRGLGVFPTVRLFASPLPHKSHGTPYAPAVTAGKLIPVSENALRLRAGTTWDTIPMVSNSPRQVKHCLGEIGR
jgi:hypothetical protein